MKIRRTSAAVVLITLAFTVGACAKKQPPVARPIPAPPTAGDTSAGRPPSPPEPIAEPSAVPSEPITEDRLRTDDLDQINQNSPFQPVFFAYDSAEIDGAGQQALNTNAEILKKYPEWVITIEGHADERGTAEYNLALGERRAMAARAYLIALGFPPNRLNVVSYGKEFPFDPSHNEAAWAKNRRAQFVVTSR